MKQLLLQALGLCVFVLLLSTSCNRDPHTYAMIETEYGNIKVRLFNETPRHRDNFIKLAEEGFYDSLLFHRVIRNFMIQGGDPNSKNRKSTDIMGQGDVDYTLEAEIGLPHLKGALAAARLGDNVNPKKESSGAQFFIVQGRPQTDQQLDVFERQKNIKYNDTQRKIYTELGGTPMLDMDYTVFGEVVEGLDVVDEIASVPTGPGDLPKKDVRMFVRILK